MRPYERYSLVAAAGLSIALHASAVVYFAHHGMQPVRVQSLPAGATQIRMTLAPPAPVRATPPPDPPRMLARSDPPAPVLRTVPASARVVRSVAPRLPVPAAGAMVRPIPVADVLMTAAVAVDTTVRQPLPVVLNATQESYLQQLLTHIDSHKFYPRSARRRGQEGAIKVSFMLHADGSIRALQVEGGSRVLRAAAERAVLSAQPVPAPPASMHFPEKIRFDMVFRLG